MTEKNYDRELLKQKFIEVRGYWDESLEGLLELDPEYFEAYLNLTSIPWKRGHLDPKTKEFVYLAVYACATHLYVPGIKFHIQKALELGATKEELVEVFQLVSAVGVHTYLEGMPLLIEELDRLGLMNYELDDHKKKVKEEFIRKRGYWNEFWDGLLLIDDESLQAYAHSSGIPWEKGPLTPKQKELIYIAGDASATHLFTMGWKHHIRNAMKMGITKEEIMEVYQIVAEIGMDSFREGMPMLIEALKEMEKNN